MQALQPAYDPTKIKMPLSSRIAVIRTIIALPLLDHYASTINQIAHKGVRTIDGYEVEEMLYKGPKSTG